VSGIASTLCLASSQKPRKKTGFIKFHLNREKLRLSKFALKREYLSRLLKCCFISASFTPIHHLHVCRQVFLKRVG